MTDQPHELLDAAHGRIAVLRRDELFVESVEVYEVVVGGVAGDVRGRVGIPGNIP